jgi:Ca2+/Na+ antiporter
VGRIFLLISAISFFVFVRTERKVTKKEAFFLLFIYLSFFVSQILFLAK